MNVGLPGTGIGGVFYLLSAICMPLVEALRGGRSSERWRVVGRQTLMALGIIGGLWLTGLMLVPMLGGLPLLAAALQGGGMDGRMTPNVLRAATLAVSLGTLAVVIGGVWIASVFVKDRPRPAAVRAPAKKRLGDHLAVDHMEQSCESLAGAEWDAA